MQPIPMLQVCVLEFNVVIVSNITNLRLSLFADKQISLSMV
jgi:hypothetical protein